MTELGVRSKRVSAIVTSLKLKSSGMNKTSCSKPKEVIFINWNLRSAKFNHNMIMSSINSKETWRGNSKKKNVKFRSKWIGKYWTWRGRKNANTSSSWHRWNMNWKWKRRTRAIRLVIKSKSIRRSLSKRLKRISENISVSKSRFSEKKRTG